MNRFFNLDNPVWRFVGNIADMFLLSLLWYLSCLPLFTAGAATTAVYYVTLKLVRNQEGYTFASFRKSFALNFKQGTLIWLLFASVGLILGADIYWGIHNASGVFLLPAFLIVALIYLLNLAFIFPFLARCQNTTKAILKMNFAISLRSFLPVLSTLLVTAGVFSVGIFVFWPLLLIAPGFSAYINSYIFNRILDKYQMGLPE